MAGHATVSTITSGEAFCLTCAYPLHPLDRPTGACPECGRCFDLADPSAFSQTPNQLRLRRIIKNVCRRVRPLYEAYLRAAVKPTRWLWPAAIAVQVISVVVSILLLGQPLWPVAFLGCGLGLLLLAYLPYIVARRDLGQQGHFPKEAVHTDRVVWRRIRKTSLWLTFFLLLSLPFYLCFLINLHAFNNTAHRIDTGGVQVEMNHIGLFPIRRQIIGHGGAEFETPGRRTLLYRPAWGRDYYDLGVRHVIGHWFVSDQPLNPGHSFGQAIERHFW